MPTLSHSAVKLLLQKRILLENAALFDLFDTFILLGIFTKRLSVVAEAFCHMTDMELKCYSVASKAVPMLQLSQLLNFVMPRPLGGGGR